jgi:predicted deacetylase
MLEGGKRRLEDLLGTPVRGFVAPAWLEPRGFARDLLAAGFTWHEGTTWIEHLGPAGRRARTPVVGFATRTAARRLAALAWAAALVPALAAAPRAWPVRVALHPTDRRSPAVMRAAARAVGVLALRHTSESYSRALGAAGGRPGSRGATGLSLEPR